MSLNSRGCRRRAFTLVELLVVIGVVALLIALLLPALDAARREAQSVVCRSNLRQIALAAQMYAQEHRAYVGWAAGGVDRKTQLYPYLRQGSSNADVDPRHVWHCPTNHRPDEEASYGFNANLNWVKLHRIRRWSETVAVVDGGLLDSRLPSLITHCFPPSRPTGANIIRPNPRHRHERANYAMADGHVEASPMTEPFYPGPAGTWLGNGITNPSDPAYKDELWDLY